MPASESEFRPGRRQFSDDSVFALSLEGRGLG